MRRKDREQTREEALRILDACDWGTLAMTATDGTPYAIPLNLVRKGETLYFHCAAAGEKLDCLRLNPAVCVTFAREVKLMEKKFTTAYESAVVLGTAQEVSDSGDKRDILLLICERFAPSNPGAEQEISKHLSHTSVWEIAISQITGKANRR